MGDILVLVVVGLMFTGLHTLCGEFLTLLEERTSRNWPTKRAIIIGYKLHDASDPESSWHDEWTIRLQYSYEVDAACYSGFVRLASLKADETTARAFSGALVNQEILIRYKPNSPAKSLYLHPIQSQNYPMHRADRLLRRVFWLCFR
jgi:hypothetical protein